MILLLKPLLTAVFLRAGAVGGMLTPALATGAAMGSVVALAINTWTEHHVSVPAISLTCAAGVLAITQRAPIWAAIFVWELATTAMVVTRPLRGRCRRGPLAPPSHRATSDCLTSRRWFAKCREPYSLSPHQQLDPMSPFPEDAVNLVARRIPFQRRMTDWIIPARRTTQIWQSASRSWRSTLLHSFLWHRLQQSIDAPVVAGQNT